MCKLRNSFFGSLNKSKAFNFMMILREMYFVWLIESFKDL